MTISQVYFSDSFSHFIFCKTLQSVLNYFLISHEELEIVSVANEIIWKSFIQAVLPFWLCKLTRQIGKNIKLFRGQSFTNCFISKIDNLDY